MSVEGVGRALATSLDVPASVMPAQQVAALCYRIVHKQVQVLLITSRETGRWILPKGWPIDGLTPAQTAAREAREEAGVKGAVAEQSVGSLSYTKIMGDQTEVPCIMAVYAVRVEDLMARYPEKNQRRRKWVSLDEAAGMLQEPEAQQVLSDFASNPMVQTKTTRRVKG